MRIATLLVLLGLNLTTACAQTLEVRVDPRVELLCAALSQSKWLLGPAPSTLYARDIRQRFSPFRGHPSVRDLDHLSEVRGVSLHGLAGWILTLSPSFAVLPDRPADPNLVRAVGGETILAKLAADLAALAHDSDFAALTAAYQPFYDKVRNAYLGGVDPDSVIGSAFGYLGGQPRNYRIVLAPLLPKLPPMVFVGPTETVLIRTPERISNGEPVFIERAAIGGLLPSELIWFDAARLAVIPAVSSEPERRDRHASWAAYLGTLIDPVHPPPWREILLDSLVRAIVVRMRDVRAANPEDLHRLGAGGFALTPWLVLALSGYSSNRESYPSLNAFMPRLLDSLDDLEPAFAGSGEPKDLGLADVWLTDQGVPVKAVARGSLAASAGIRTGDTVQSIAGIRITGSESYLKAWHRWEASKEGESVPFRIIRGSKAMTINVVMRRDLRFEGFRRKARRTP